MLKKKLSSPPAPEPNPSNWRTTVKCLKESLEPQNSDETVVQRRGTPDDASGSDTAKPSECREIPIVEFCDRALKYLTKKCTCNKHKKESELRRIVTFLTQHPSVKKTTDLTPTVVREFAASCEGLSPSCRLQLLEQLRVLSNLAIQWGCLNPDPFEGYPLPKVKSLARTYDQSRLDADEISRLMAYLEAKKDTWAGHRFYALTATVLYAGLKTGEAMKLTLSDCDLAQGVIRVPGRVKSDRSKYPSEVRIPPPLAQILSEWTPVLLKGYVRSGGLPPYGSKRAEDGGNYIPNEAEQRVLSDMLRWREQGMSVGQITRELNSRGIPTKQGKQGWNRASVTMILNRAWRPNSHAVDSPSEHNGRKKSRKESDSLALFPILEYRTAHPTRERRNRSGIRVEILRDACKALGIKVTLASLRRFYFESDRRIPDRGRDSCEHGAVRVERTRQRPPSVATWPPGRCPVTIMSDEIVMISGKVKKPTHPQFGVIKALIDAGPAGLSGDELISKSGRLGYRHILKTLAKDEDWNLRIRLAGLPHGRYRLAMPDDE